MSDQKFSIDNSKAFFEFLQTERNQFAVWAGTQFPPGEGYTDERVQCENILIAFDQAVEQLKKRDQYIQVLTNKAKMNIKKERIIEVLKNNKTDLYDESGNVIHGIDATDFEYVATEIINEIDDKQHHADQLAEALREVSTTFKNKATEYQKIQFEQPDRIEYYEGLSEGYQECYNVLQTALTNYEQGNDGWISVEDDLPKLGEKVRCKLSKDIGLGHTERTLHRMKHNRKWSDYHDLVTHWRPLPAPPTNYEQNNKTEKA